jgi:hypothetical protein
MIFKKFHLRATRLLMGISKNRTERIVKNFMLKSGAEIL